MGMIDSHPALKAASPQAPISDWFIGDDLHHNGACFYLKISRSFINLLSTPMTFCMKCSKPFNFKTPDGYDFFLRMGPLGNSDSVLLRVVRRLDRVPTPFDLRRFLAGAQHPAASQKYPLRGNDRWRLV